MYFDRANNYWVAAVSLGYKAGKRVRRKVTGRTKTEVKAKLRELRRDLDSGVRSSATYTVGAALDDWLANGLSGRSDRTKELYRDTVKPLRERLGNVKLKELTAGDVQETLDALAGRLSTRSLQITRLCLERAIRHAEVRDLVGRNVAALVKAPAGRAGRPSKSLTLEQARDLLQAAAGSRLYAYVVLSVTTGLRTEELRALRWNEVDLDVGTVAVYRAVRATADTKTLKSRRVLSLPRLAVQALREHRARQAEDRLLAGVLWEDHSLTFASAVGTPLDRHNVLREFRKVTQAAGLGTGWVPREMRHTFVSLLSSNGTALEDIADLVGHRGTATTEIVTRTTPIAIRIASAVEAGAVCGLGGLLPVASTVAVTTAASDTSQPNTNAAPFLTPPWEGSTIMNVVSGIGSSAIARPIKMRSNVIAAAPVSPRTTVFGPDKPPAAGRTG